MSDWAIKEKAIEELFRCYSIGDIAKSLLCMSLWLPNLSSQMKNSYLTLHFISRKPVIFQDSDKLKTYADFQNLASKLIDLVPSFSSTEDYFPETDWGEVKFYFKDEIYKIFYGNEITDIYDYLSLFEIKYVSIDKNFKEKIERSPADELQICLALQNKIITTIQQSLSDEKRQSIHHGHYEIPDEAFWTAIYELNFYSQFKQLVPDDCLKNYSVALGVEKFPKDAGDFIHVILYGLRASWFFLEYDGQYFMLNPRRYSCILIEKWFALLQENKDKLFKNRERKNFYASHALAGFINQRIMSDNKFKMVSATFEGGRPHQSIFASAILHKDKILLFYLFDENSDGIEQEVILVNEAIELLKKKPYTLALHLDSQNMQILPTDTGKTFKPLVVYLYPNVCISGLMNMRAIPKSLDGEFFDMSSFLGIFDEISGIDELLDFCDHLNNDKTPIMHLANLMDRYAAYKDSHKIITEGASDYNAVWLDPHWGAGYKYERLKEFWSTYPNRNYFDHPRSWVPQVTGTRVRLVARGYKGCAIFSKVADTNIFVTAPFNNMTLEEARTTDMQLMCLDDYITSTADILEELAVFKTFKDVNITFLPESLIVRDDGLKHLRKEVENLELRVGAVGIVKDNVLVARIVFDVEKTSQLFFEPDNNNYEIDFFSFVLYLFNRIRVDRNMMSIINQIKVRFKKRKPRHTFLSIDTGVCFDERITSAIVPDQHAFKNARKQVSGIVRGLDIDPGDYELDDARIIINKIRDEFVKEIDAYILRYDFATNIKTLMQNIESLTHDAQSELAMIEKSVDYEVDYDRIEKFNKVHTEFLSRHRDYRYVIEKFIQHSKTGGETLVDLDIQYLLAFSNEVGCLYYTSNIIYYGLYPIGLNISDDYIFKAIENGNVEEKSEAYGKALSADQIYNDNDKDRTIDTEDEQNKYQLKIDEVFYQEKGFSITNFLDVCVIMANYPAYNKSIENSSFYVASIDEVIAICKTEMNRCESEEIEKILEILVLDKDKMTMIIGDSNPSKDLPVWEHNKRPYRYTIKPIIKFDDGRLIWGPYSVKKARGIWVKQLGNGSTPYDFQNEIIETVMAQRKDAIGKKVENKAHEILQRHTSFAEKNIYLHKRDKQGNHPLSLGDYDVLAYLEDKKLVLNVECKDLLGAYCSKDAKRLRDKLYGNPRDKNYISKVINREEYLANNLGKIFSVLGWQCDDVDQLKVCSLFTVRQLFWWYLFPPYETNVEFVKLSKLNQYIKEM